MQKRFITEYFIDGQKYIGWIYADTPKQAKDFLRQRKETEEFIGGPVLDGEEVEDVMAAINADNPYSSTGFKPLSESPESKRWFLTKDDVMASEEMMMMIKRSYDFSDESFEDYKKFLSDRERKVFYLYRPLYIRVEEDEEGYLHWSIGGKP